MAMLVISGDCMIKILLAMNSQALAEVLQEQLSGQFEVLYSRDADETLASLGLYRPDVLVLDMMLGGVDGISILQAARDSGTCDRVVAFTNYIGRYTGAMLEDLNVYHLSKPPSSGIEYAGRIADVALWEREPESITQRIRNLLLTLGFKMNTENYRIIECAITLFYQNPAQALSAQLYPAVAKACRGTATQVEKAIRTGIECAWKNGNENVWRLYFAPGTDGKISKPSNGDFLMRMAVCLKENTKDKGEMKAV